MNKETMNKAGYQYVQSIGNGEHILLELESNKMEVWFVNKNHASYGIIWNNTHLEFARTALSIDKMKVKRIPITMRQLEKQLPHGSGIDCDWFIEDKGKYFKCHNSFHCMDENGYYCGYSVFELIIYKRNPLKFKLHFIDKHGNKSQYLNQKYQLRDYLEDTFHYAIEQMVKPIVNEYQMSRLYYKEPHLFSYFLEGVIPYEHNKTKYKPIQFAKHSHIGSYMQCTIIGANDKRSTKSFEVIPTDKMILFIKDNMIPVDYDTITFELFLYANGTAMLIARYGQIIGSNWISLIDMKSIPELILSSMCKQMVNDALND